MTQLHEAVINKGKKTVARILADDPTEVHAIDLEGDTPLHLAVLQRPELTLLLLEYESAVNAQNNNNDTPLHFVFANLQNSYTAIKPLLQYGADINIKNNNGLSPADLARSFSDLPLMGDMMECIQELLV